MKERLGHVRATTAHAVRETLRSGVERSPRFRRLVQRAASELDGALGNHVYGSSYFGEDRDPLDRMGLSGYERYDRDTSNANVAAYLVWRWFDAEHTLDVGCAMGFVVEALREVGVHAHGVDVSQYAIDHAAAGAAGHVRRGDLLQRLPFDDGAFDLVTALETLEHLPPAAIPAAVAELRRVTRHYVVATIPSFGPNEHGPGGWFQVKVRDDRVAHYESLGSGYEGPIPFDDLYRDTEGEPIEGHLTIASFAWWTRRFAEAGLERCGHVERRIHPELARFGLTKYWNLYVLRVAGTAPPPAQVRDPGEIAALERRWGLADRRADPEDEERVRAALGAAP